MAKLHTGRHHADGSCRLGGRRHAPSCHQKLLYLLRYQTTVGNSVPVTVLHRHILVAHGAEASVNVDGIGCQKDRILRHLSLKNVIGGQLILTTDMTGLTNADGRCTGQQDGIFTTGHIFFQERVNLFHLLTANHLCLGKALSAGSIDTHNTGSIDIPLILLHPAENTDGHTIQGPVTILSCLSNSPVKGTIVYTILSIKIIFVCNDICFQLVEIHVSDAEEHGRGLDPSAFLVAQLAGNTCAVSHVRIAGTVNDGLSLNGLQTALGMNDHTLDPILSHHRLHKAGVVKDLNSGFGEHLIDYPL